jgi:hypothetical protein
MGLGPRIPGLMLVQAVGMTKPGVLGTNDVKNVLRASDDVAPSEVQHPPALGRQPIVASRISLLGGRARV